MTDWLKSWSGRLSALAAAVGGLLTYDASGLILSALGFLPSSPLRLALVVLTVSATIWLPKKAAEKDNAKAD